MKMKKYVKYLLCLLMFVFSVAGQSVICPQGAKAQTKADWIVVESYEEFSKVSNEINEEIAGNFKDIVENGGEGDQYALMRLHLKVKGSYEDFDTCGAVVMKGPEGLYLLQYRSREAAKAAYEKLKNDKNLEYVEPDRIVSLCDYSGAGMLENESSSADMEIKSTYNSWGVTKSNCDVYAKYLKNNKKNKKVIVAVVDSGVDKNHSFLKGRILKKGYDFADGDSNPEDKNGHGTHVSGTIVDCTKGLKNIKILPVKVMDANGRGTVFSIILGVNYAVQKGANVINLSLGGDHLSSLDSAINSAGKKGVICVAAAGNESGNVSNSCPGHVSSAITVAAVNQSLKRAYFSNYGKAVDVVAPGVLIKSSVPGGKYEYYDGTSMAAPHISAIIAMLKVTHPGMKSDEAHKYIKKICQDLGKKGKDIYYGYGFPDMRKAIPKYKIKPSSIKFAKSEIEIIKGNKETLEVTIKPVDVTETDLTWESSDPSIVSVSKKGKIHAKRLGTATITVTTVNKKKAECRVTVVPSPVYPTSVEITDDAKTMDIGNVYQLSAVISPSNATETKLVWRSSNSRVADVDSTGKVTALKQGEAIITVSTVNGCSDFVKITVNALVIQPTNIILNYSEKTIFKGEGFRLTATILPENATNTLVTWESDNSDVAYVSYNGYVTGSSPGTALITAKTSNGITAGCYVTVRGYPDLVYFEYIKYTIKVGEELQLKTVVVPEGSDTSNFYFYTDSDVIRVTSDGVVTGIMEGEGEVVLCYGEDSRTSVDILVIADDGSGGGDMGDNGDNTGGSEDGAGGNEDML